MSMVLTNPKLLTFGIGLALTIGVSLVIGMTSPELAFAKNRYGDNAAGVFF